jgi:UDP-N-acetylglucosamine--N-acetylmuramyl-(pentapeptide) pyrophosphoryl-undecaprenol N-acetylglucosamine transferase
VSPEPGAAATGPEDASASPSVLSVVLAGGGTAGHTSPLIATAFELAEQHPGIRLTALGTARGLETTVVPAAGLPLELIPPVPMPRRPTPELLRVPGRLRASVAAAAKVLGDTRAGVVLGFGGYVSTPAYLAARRLKVPIVVHEQNVLPGLANKLAARFTQHVYTSFAETDLPHATWIGLPMRRAITELDRVVERPAARAEFGLAPDRPVLLVSGGSQGAARINHAVEGARDALLAAGIQILHVLGPKNFGSQTAHTHPDNGAVYRPVAYVERMERAYAAAEVMLGRCGASTVLETAVVGLPAVFVPYPHGNGEQRRNARLVVDAGGGLLVEDDDCTPDLVAARIPELVDQPGRLEGMSVALRGAARGDAASTLARRTLEVARTWP